MTIVGYHTKMVSFSKPRKCFLLVELCDLSGKHHSLKSFYTINSQMLEASTKR